MNPSLALVPLLLFSSPWKHYPDRVQRHHVGPWTVETRQDRFSGGLGCRLWARHMDYERGALVIHLARGLDTSTAIYRVDDGQPVAVRSELFQMARLGFAVYRDDLANPSAGLVRIPQERLLKARVVKIEAGSQGAVIRLEVAGFGEALDVARADGCDAAAFAGRLPQ